MGTSGGEVEACGGGTAGGTKAKPHPGEEADEGFCLGRIILLRCPLSYKRKRDKRIHVGYFLILGRLRFRLFSSTSDLAGSRVRPSSVVNPDTRRRNTP
ncbi:hypothetical protein EJB05_01667, partial [Eragrostis curvula]